MGSVTALTLPGLVIILVIAVAVEAVLVRRRRRRGDTGARHHVAQAGFDALGLALAPGSQHEKERRHSEMLRREDVGDAAPPHSVVDLDAGTARLVLPAEEPGAPGEPGKPEEPEEPGEPGEAGRP